MIAASLFYQKIKEGLGQRIEYQLTNDTLPNAFLLSLLPPYLLKGPVFYLVNDNLELKKFAETYRLLTKAALNSNLSLTIWPNEQTAPLPLLYSLLKHENQIIATTWENFSKAVPSPELLENSLIKIKAEQRLKRDDFIEQLVLAGFEFNTQADQMGLFAKRGSLVDVWPQNNDYPLRLEFDSQKILTISSFNPITKKIITPLESAEILPVVLDTSDKTALKNYLIDSSLIFTASISHFNYPLIDFSNSPKFSNQLDKFIKDLKAWQKQGWQTIILTNKEKALTELFVHHQLVLDESLKIIALDQQLPPITYGFKLAADKIVFLTDYDIFGHQALSPQTTVRRTQAAFVAQLKKGDYVVHLDHGIAKFNGLVKAKIEAIEREYLLLNYAGADKLYLPVEQADKIEKYLGAANPKLQALGKTSTWPTIVKKVKADAIKTAQELLNLYAQRQLSVSPAFQDFPEEQELASSFAYQETPDQLKTWQEVVLDFKKSQPADRLICGDVGFGKTEVAIRASFKAVLNNCQVAILCPTTILAQQHEDTFAERLKSFPLSIASLSRFQSQKQQTAIIQKLKTGQVDIVIGTHRLLSADIKFKNLGLIIIDEEQRFGVKAKEKLKKLRSQAHVLTLTATPIPRTLHLSLSNVRNISVMATPPPGRLPIITEIHPYEEKLIKQALENELNRNGQAYYLYNDVATIKIAAKKLLSLLPQAKIGIAHGQLPEKELAQTMHLFDTRQIDILLCSTIIENGLDLPNVNTLIVENSPKFGLAQLYQLRGRIGRGPTQAYAYFLYHSEKLPGKAGERLRALKEATELGSGFELALRDMEIRGVGSILGKEQHGKISAIGLTLYERLLEQTVEEIQTGITLEPISDIAIDLPLTLGIPEDFEPNEQKRLQLYQKLARISSFEGLQEMANKLGHNLPQPLLNLLEILEIKLLAQQTDIISIEASGKSKISLTFKNNLDYQKVALLLEKQPSWQDSGNKLKIDKEKLGDQWLAKLKEAIIIFRK